MLEQGMPEIRARLGDRKRSFPVGHLFRVCVLLFLTGLLPLQAANSLKGHPSPYLALHGDDPVDWLPWGAEALKLARKEDKLLFVSVGYFACHWCHVMQRESFADADVAAMLNKYFVSVKVDRELDPVLDARLMTFLRATAGTGGWPLNVFLTPDAHPLVGIVYRPRDEFLELLGGLQRKWESDRGELHAAAIEVDQLLADSNVENQAIVAGKTLSELEKKYRQEVMERADMLQGGFNGQARFPFLPQLQAALNFNRDSPATEEVEFLRLTLDQMIGQGLRDHVGEGFYRYTVDPDWQTPHFEKMLYTNALMVNLLLDASKGFHRPEYKAVALGTLAFMDREMSASGGALVASLSAVDDNDVEGGYYLWRQAELKQLLNKKNLAFINAAWGMSQADDGSGLLPVRVSSDSTLRDRFGLTQSELAARFSQVRSILIKHRSKTRVKPRDEKRLSGWNGLALSAFAQGYGEDERLRKRGADLAVFLSQTVWDGTTLYNAVDDKNRGLGNGSLEDYAYVSRGLLEWGEATGDQASLMAGQAIMRSAWQRFFSEKGWRLEEQTLLPLQKYQTHLGDHTLPSPEAVLIQATRLSAALPVSKGQGGDRQLLKKIQKLLSTVTQGMVSETFLYPSLIDVAADAP